MTNTHIVSTNKIIFFVVFICAAIMASLFVYHSSQKVKQPLPPEVGMIFPAPRDIKPFKLVANDQPFTEKNLYKHWTLMFFGFTHCAKVCPTTLDLMNRVYVQLNNKYPDLQVVLVSVDPERDTQSTLTQYTQSYNPSFIGATGEIQELRKLQSQLGIFAARDKSTSPTDYQIQHTSSILLINPQGKWAGMYKYGLKPDELIKGLEAGINEKTLS